MSHQRGPRRTLFEKRPKGRRCKAKFVWDGATNLIGVPPEWMLMLPANSKHEGEHLRTTRWIIKPKDKEETIVMNGAARKVYEELTLKWRESNADVS